MTKRDRRPLGPRGHHRANLHLTIIDNHPINKQFHQLATLGEGQVVERWPEAAAEGVDAVRQGQDIDLLLCLGLDLPELWAHTLLRLGQLVPFALEFLATDDFSQIDVEQAGMLPLDLGQRLTQGALARLEGLRKPLAPLGALEFVGDECRLGEHLTELLPDQHSERLGADISGNTALPQGRPQRVGATPAPIITLAGLTRPPRTGQLTLATAHEPAQQVRLDGIITARRAAIPLKPRWRGVKECGANDGRHRNGRPVLGRRGPMADARPHRPQGGLTLPGGHRATLPTVGYPGIDCIAHNSTYAGG